MQRKYGRVKWQDEDLDLLVRFCAWLGRAGMDRKQAARALKDAR
jgi:hypothetical protein